MLERIKYAADLLKWGANPRLLAQQEIDCRVQKNLDVASVQLHNIVVDIDRLLSKYPYDLSLEYYSPEKQWSRVTGAIEYSHLRNTRNLPVAVVAKWIQEMVMMISVHPQTSIDQIGLHVYGGMPQSYTLWLLACQPRAISHTETGLKDWYFYLRQPRFKMNFDQSQLYPQSTRFLSVSI